MQTARPLEARPTLAPLKYDVPLAEPSVLAQVLRLHQVFAVAPERALAPLLSSCRERRVDAREPLYRSGEPATAVFLLCEGVVRVFHRSLAGLEATQGVLLPASLLGAEAVLAAEAQGAPARYADNAMALRPTRVVEIAPPAFLALLRQSPASTLEVARDLASRARHAARRGADVMLPVPARLAALLLTYADLAGIHTDGGLVIKLALTHEDLANDLGVAVKSIARTLRAWTAEGLIERRKGWFVVKRRAVLELRSGDGGGTHLYHYDPRR